MAARQAVTAATWASAERLFADLSVPLKDVADLVRLAPIQLSLEAKRRGWPPRTARQGSRKVARPAKAKAAAPKRKAARQPAAAMAAANTIVPEGAASGDAQAGSGESAEAAGKPKSKTPSTLLQRVYATIDLELGKLEEHTGKSSQDRERASRALSQMVNSLEKAIEMQREMSKRTPRGGSAKDKKELAHAEDLRRAIADRLARLSGKRDSGKRSR